MSTKHYAVKTADTDGGGRRNFATLANAVKRFEEMSGMTIDAAIRDVYWRTVDEGGRLPKVEELRSVRAVSIFGTVVTFEAISDEAIKGAVYRREQRRADHAAAQRAAFTLSAEVSTDLARVAAERTAFTLAAEAAFAGCEA